MGNSNRRNFLKKSAGSALTMSLLGNPAVWASANDKIRVCTTGVHGRGNDHIGNLERLDGVEMAALCDVDEKLLNRKADELEAKTGRKIKRYVDFRDMVKDPDIDVVTIATPNHWHSLQSMWACEAGKDVYVEKPLSHNIREGRLLVEIARKYNRIVQQGTQIRSSEAVQEAMEHLHNGTIGEVYYAKGTCYKWRDTIGHKEPSPIPEGVHYNLWLGPAEERPFTQNRFHYNWHWHWDYGNGDIGNQGVHQMDVARWGLGVELPDLVSSVGGHFMFDDDQETPNTLVSSMKYEKENKMLVFEVRHWITNDELGEGGRGNVVGNLFLGSKGIMVVPSYNSYQIYFGRDRKPGPGRNAGGNHYANFIEAVRKRDHTILNADVLEGHYSAALCHLANAAYLVEDTLKIDPETEMCTNNEEANKILQGTYRKPFVLPDV